MAIPQGRLSTTVVEDVYLPPEGTITDYYTSREAGPIAIEDTSEGLLYQTWILTYDKPTGDFIVTPTITGSPSTIITVADVKYVSFTFDQTGRVIIAYSTSVSSFLYWYDTGVGQTVTTDLGSDVLGPTIYLDDKRYTQSAPSDMLLWYTKEEIGGGTFELFMLLQRERYLIEYLWLLTYLLLILKDLGLLMVYVFKLNLVLKHHDY